MKRMMAVVAAVACGIGLAGATPAEAKSYGYYTKSYAVQVEYWFFDTDYTYWSTKFETNDLGDAEFVYNALLIAKENGDLNTAAPSTYWRYIAVDVRLITVWTYHPPIPRVQSYQSLRAAIP